jgi:hypothetical protein
VTVNGNSELAGSVKSDRLIVNGNGLIRGVNATPEPPVAHAQTVHADDEQPITLAGFVQQC